MNEDAAAFVELYIGKPYEPKGLHCWELVRRCQEELFGRALPPVLVAPERKRELIGLMDLRHSYTGWHQAEKPEHGAVVFMTRNGQGAERAACHSGVWLELDGGGVLHTDESHGVVFETVPELTARNWADFGFFVPA